MTFRSVPKRASIEHAHQSAFFSWCRLPTNIAAYSGLEFAHASLNGVKLSKAQAGKAKAAGMLKGVIDVLLPIRRGGHSGLWIEFKAGRNNLTEEQTWFAGRMLEEGFCVVTVWNWNDAVEAVKDYYCLGDYQTEELSEAE